MVNENMFFQMTALDCNTDAHSTRLKMAQTLVDLLDLMPYLLLARRLIKQFWHYPADHIDQARKLESLRCVDLRDLRVFFFK